MVKSCLKSHIIDPKTKHRQLTLRCINEKLKQPFLKIRTSKINANSKIHCTTYHVIAMFLGYKMVVVMGMQMLLAGENKF